MTAYPRKAPCSREMWDKYVALFQSLHLHRITANTHLEEIQQINAEWLPLVCKLSYVLMPQAGLLQLFTKHYYASGGDVPYFTDLSTQAMWFGLLIDRVC
ncbi:UNVERIFIED_CONTAM: hypothetical protein FKN15_006847 [Acipenser sinensis]